MSRQSSRFHFTDGGKMNKSNNKKSYSYYDALNAYFGLSLPNQLTTNSSHLFLGLLHASNLIGLGEEFTFPNSRAMDVSGISSIATLTRARKTLSEFRFKGESIFSYETGKDKHTCGTYNLFSNVLITSYCQFDNKTLLKRKQNETKTDNINRSEEIREDKNINNENVKKIISFINEKILNAKDWVPDDKQKTSLEKIAEKYDMSKVTSVIDNAVKRDVKMSGKTGAPMSGLFDWLEKGLEHYDYFYNKPKHVLLNSDEAIDALKEKLRNGTIEQTFQLSQNACEILRAIGYRITKQMPVYKPVCRENELALLLHLIDEDAIVEGLQEAKESTIRPAEAVDFVTEKIIGTTVDKMEEERRNAGTSQ